MTIKELIQHLGEMGNQSLEVVIGFDTEEGFYYGEIETVEITTLKGKDIVFIS